MELELALFSAFHFHFRTGCSNYYLIFRYILVSSKAPMVRMYMTSPLLRSKIAILKKCHILAPLKKKCHIQGVPPILSWKHPVKKLQETMKSADKKNRNWKKSSWHNSSFSTTTYKWRISNNFLHVPLFFSPPPISQFSIIIVESYHSVKWCNFNYFVKWMLIFSSCVFSQ